MFNPQKQSSTQVNTETHCSAERGKPGGTGDDEGQKAQCVAKDFTVVLQKGKYLEDLVQHDKYFSQ